MMYLRHYNSNCWDTKEMSGKMADTSSGHNSITLRFGHVGHFMKPGDFEDIPVSRILQFAQGVGLLKHELKGCTKNR